MTLALSRQVLVPQRDQRDDPNRDWLPHRADGAVRLSSKPHPSSHGIMLSTHRPYIHTYFSHFHGRYLDKNKISGTIPTEIGALTGLEWLYVCSRASRASFVTRHPALPLTSRIHMSLALSRQGVEQQRDQRDDPNRDS